MKRMIRFAIVSAVCTVLLAPPVELLAQVSGGGNGAGGGGTGRGGARGGRGQRDPAQMQERRMERYREQLEIKNDDEWAVIRQHIERVLQAQREARGTVSMFRRSGGNTRGPQAATSPNATGRGNRGGRGNMDPPAEATALQAALESKAGEGEVKDKLSRLRASQKQRTGKLAKAQADLQRLLTVRQEAVAILMGLLP